MIILHFFEDFEDIPEFVKELYPDTKLDIHYCQINISRNKWFYEIKRLTIVIYTNNIQPIEEIDIFLRLKYPTYYGYTVSSIIPYKPQEDYTYPNRQPEDQILAVIHI